MSIARITIVLVLSSLCGSAYADQCQVIDRGVADRATAALAASHGRVIRYCAPCGDTMPPISAAFTPRSVNFDGSELHLDGRAEDLAYLYLEVAPNVFENFALRTGCPAIEVPETLRYSPSGPTVSAFGPVPPALARVGWGASGAAPRRSPRVGPNPPAGS